MDIVVGKSFISTTTTSAQSVMRRAASPKEIDQNRQSQADGNMNLSTYRRVWKWLLESMRGCQGDCGQNRERRSVCQ